MAKSSTDLAALLQGLQQPGKPDIWQALGQLGAQASRAGRLTVGRPAQETLGEALGGFATSLQATRQQDQANKLRQLQTLSAVQQITAADRAEKNAVKKDELTEAARVQIPLMLADPAVKAQLPAPKFQAFEIFAKAKPLEAMKQLLSMKGISANALSFQKIMGEDGKMYWQGLDKGTGVPTGPRTPAATTGTKPSRFIKTIMRNGVPHQIMFDEAGKEIQDLGEAPESKGVNVTQTMPTTPEVDPTDAAVAKELGKSFAKQMGGIRDAGEQGEFQMGRMQSIVEAMKVYEEAGGDFDALANLNLKASEFMSAIGLNPSSVGLLPEDAQPAAQFLQTQFAKGTIANIGSAKGGVPANTFSEKDRELAERTVAQLPNTKEGIQAKIFAETKASAIAKERRDRFDDLREKFERGEPAPDKFNKLPRTAQKPMTPAKAARKALAQVNREFRNKDLFSEEQRKMLRGILKTEKRSPVTDLKKIMQIQDSAKRKEALRRKLDQRK